MKAPFTFRRHLSHVLALIAGLASAHAAPAQGAAKPKAKELHVLFIGNSQIYYNDLPRMVEALAQSAPKDRPRIRADRFVAGGASLERLWNAGEGKGTARAKILEKPWDFVIVQEIYYARPESFNQYASLFHELIQKQNARTVLFCTASISTLYPSGFTDLHDKHVALGKKLQAPVAAAGKAWLTYWGDQPTAAKRLALYDKDKAHPGKKGSYIYACTLYAVLTGRSPVGLTNRIPNQPADTVTVEEAKQFQEAAWRVYQEFGMPAEEEVDADFVLQNATIYDGSLQPGKPGDIAIKGDRIVAIGKFKTRGTPRILNCAGLAVSPGFIDLHTHSDYPLQDAKTSNNLNYLTQGVTTVVTGNCGFGPVEVADYFTKLEKVGVGTNVIHQVPHNAVRQKAMGNANREPTADELRLMEDLVEKGMQDGAWGLATGLIYNPGTYCKTDELIVLAKVSARHGGFYASHIRNESTEVLQAIDEILTIARRAGLRVHISHIKVSGRRAWGKAPEVIALIRRARKDGVEVTADQYPYVASSTSLTATVIPAKYREGSSMDLLKRFDDPEIGPKMKKAIEQRIEDNLGGKSIKIARYAGKIEWQGKDLLTIAMAENKSPLEIVMDIQRNGGASIVNFNMNDEEIRLFMTEPYVATASDGSAMLPANTVPHPRSYGTFPRKIGRFAIEDKVISLEQAIRSASGLPADILQLPERGYIKTGWLADVVVFDPKTFRDRATYDLPHQYATGVQYLFVNGRLAIDEGRSGNILAGRVLRHKKN